MTVVNRWQLSRVDGTLIGSVVRESSLSTDSKKLSHPAIAKQFKFSGKSISLAKKRVRAGGAWKILTNLYPGI